MPASTVVESGYAVTVEVGGGGGVVAFTVVDALAWLLPEAGSAIDDDTVAVFERVPAEPGRTTTVTVALAPLPSDPSAQLTVAPPVQLP